MIFETHAHYDDAKFDTDREMLLAELPQRGISPVINVGSSIATTKTTLSLAQEYPFLYAAVGVHPSDVDDLMRTRMHGSDSRQRCKRQLRWERSDWIITGIRNRRYRRSRGIGLYGSLHWLNRQIFR